MTEAQSKALRLIDQGQSITTAATTAGISVTEVYCAIAERDRRQGNHQTREAS